ncbi:hypothetical protein O181_053092 [Austropuccinia psidii MF-1]|uniref:Integrase zinc-binding domain-containing protein n=1 Tax=Austropuccinia psidii MF-1 TaxID=1389203 RepID=A0A9Q3E903_9BASI|nr:hypothetical protein [Austropuccinia psidii MF-1]
MKNFRFSEWAPEGGTPYTHLHEPEGTETPILGIGSPEIHKEFFNSVMTTYAKHKQCSLLLQLLQQKYRSLELKSLLEEPCALKVRDRDQISLILRECHNFPYMGHMSEDRTKERVTSTVWRPHWEQELSEYINTCERYPKENRKHGKKYGLLQHIEEPKHPWETINMDWVIGLVPGSKKRFKSLLVIVDRYS